jgi:hypothetical protein
LQINIMFKSEVSMVSTLKLMMEYLIFQTEGGWAGQKLT